MVTKAFPVIDLPATGANITCLRKEKNYTVRDLQGYFGFEDPQAIYKWQKGKSLPTVDNLLALSVLLEVPVERILVYSKMDNITDIGQQERDPAASHFIRAWSPTDRSHYSRAA